MLAALSKAGWSGEAAAMDSTYVQAQRSAHGGKGEAAAIDSTYVRAQRSAHGGKGEAAAIHSTYVRAQRSAHGGKDPMRVDGGEPCRLRLPGISMRSTDEQPIFDRSRRPESG